MTQHLEFHPHAFIKDNKVINIAVFDESAHDSQLLNDVKISAGADEVVCCCTFGIPGIDWTYNSTTGEFRSPQPFPSWIFNEEIKQWEAPMPYPIDDNFYIWDEASTSWVQVEE